MDSDAQVRSASQDVSGAREVMTILSEWRDAERRLAAAVRGSAEESAALADVDRLRSEYQLVQQKASENAGG